MRVLVVDDEQDTADLLARLLTRVGHDVRLAEDGEHALSLAIEFQPEVVVLDIGLPGMNGLKVAKRMRALPDQASARIIALSGFQLDPGEWSAAGIDHYLLKPTPLAQVLAAMNGNGNGASHWQLATLSAASLWRGTVPTSHGAKAMILAGNHYHRHAESPIMDYSAGELRKLISASQDMVDRLSALLARAEAVLAQGQPGGDPEKVREAERIEYSQSKDGR